jgi:hypothetical protein
MSNVLKMAAVGGAVSAETDPNFKQTVLLLHGDGTNGAQNNTFLDSSTNNFTITRNPATGPNAPTQGTFSPFSLAAGQWSNFFDGTGDYFTFASNAAFAFGTGDFTVEAWVYITASKAQVILDTRTTGPSTTGIALAIDASNFPYVYVNNATLFTSSTALSPSTWTHVAMVKSSGTITLYINGVKPTTGSATSSTNLTDTACTVGTAIDYRDSTTTLHINGYLSNLRVVKGRAVYTSAFTPSTTPLGATSGGTNPPQGTETSLLTCQSNRFVDNGTANSGTGFAITRNGDVRVTPFSPFAPSAAYDPAVNGGSGYFDGSGDYLTIANNSALQFGTGDFTFEAWVYPTNLQASKAAGEKTVIDTGTSGFYVSLWTGAVHLASWGVADLKSFSASEIRNSTWSHIVISRIGTSVRCFVNGAQVDSTTTLSTNFNSSGSTFIGSSNVPTLQLQGYIAGMKIIKGSGVSSVTLPTAPPVDSSGTSLLCNFTNAGIFDNTGKNVLETVGNAQIDTTTKKYGTGSMEFDGTTDYLFIPNDVNNTLGTGDYTIEFWVYANNWTSTPVLVEYGRATNGNTPGLEFYISNTSGKLDIYGGSTTGTLLVSAGTNISTGSWTHVALTRASGSTKLFLNGTQTGSTATDTTNYTQATIFIGAYFAGGLSLNGFIDDFRITKGVARYTANFTAPTKAFPDQ